MRTDHGAMKGRNDGEIRGEWTPVALGAGAGGRRPTKVAAEVIPGRIRPMFIGGFAHFWLGYEHLFVYDCAMAGDVLMRLQESLAELAAEDIVACRSATP